MEMVDTPGVFNDPERDRVYGLHSNIPECCVDYYINVWTKKSLREMIEGNRTRFVGTNILWNYVPCDACLESENLSELHLCTIECKDFLIESGNLHTLRIVEAREKARAANKQHALALHEWENEGGACP